MLQSHCKCVCSFENGICFDATIEHSYHWDLPQHLQGEYEHL